MTHERVKKKNKQRASEMNLAAILLCIVFLFLVCHFPRILLNVHEIFMLGDMMTCGNGESENVSFGVSCRLLVKVFSKLFTYVIHNSFKILSIHLFSFVGNWAFSSRSLRITCLTWCISLTIKTLGSWRKVLINTLKKLLSNLCLKIFEFFSKNG